ncbi:Mar9 Transposase [Phytophthora megakarya]|uniref:Mar9 Transposase n=1 Tax=Phytophthora megakarya TaxID=4795 RepID=A0A225V942_9STRA|nr:Mar9 Transposase [Phytophthora megakarya]
MIVAAVTRSSLFDGKIGIWDFINQVVAQCNSYNRAAGTYVILSFTAKWPPADRYKPIYIQQDNANPHVSPDDPGIFDASHYQEGCYNINEVIRAVQKSFSALKPEKLDNMFLTLRKVMECVLGAGGGNEYKLPHMSKIKLRKLCRV